MTKEQRNEVYIVSILETEDGIPFSDIYAFGTMEKAKAFFNGEVEQYKSEYETDKYGAIEDETETLFSWTKEIGFACDALEITINKQIVR